MDLLTWAALLKRSGGQCEARCARQCDTRLEIDHRHSRGIGGETSLANCRFLCARRNRERGMTHDEKWEAYGYFDGHFNYDKLRYTQATVGPDAVHQHGDLFIAEHRKKLLGSVSLFVLC